MTPAQQIALWADRLRHMPASGLRFAPTLYDHERYQAIEDMAMETLAFAAAEVVVSLGPLRLTVPSDVGLPTGDAAIIDDVGRILLISMVAQWLWVMPGGLLNVGEPPAQGSVRERCLRRQASPAKQWRDRRP